MANFTQEKDRHVIPNWRSYENTAKLGELNGSNSIQLDSSFKPDIFDLLEEWEDNKSINIAADLLGVALICNQENNEQVKSIAKFVIESKEFVTSAVLDSALKILEPKKTEIEINFEISSLDSFLLRSNLTALYPRIKFYKSKLKINPRNAVVWVELSRLYSIFGLDEKAERAMRNAVFLAPNNRFVLRNAARFFIHLGDVDFAHDTLRKSDLVKQDPWVMATEIAVADLRGRNSIFVNKGKSLVDSDNFHPFNISELSSAIATLEMINSNSKKSKLYLNKSLINPNDNSLAQAEWISQEKNSNIQIDPSVFNLGSTLKLME